MSRVLLAHNGLWSGWRVVVSPTGERTLVRDPGAPPTDESKVDTSTPEGPRRTLGKMGQTPTRFT